MTDPGDLGAVGNTRPLPQDLTAARGVTPDRDPHGGRGADEDAQSGSSDGQAHSGQDLDAIDRWDHAAHAAPVFELLRERILAETARALRLEESVTRPSAYETALSLGESDASMEAPVRVDRLTAAQNRLAAMRRRSGWSQERIEAAVSQGTLRGVRDALDVLETMHELDERAWSVVSAVVFELARRLGTGIRDALRES